MDATPRDPSTVAAMPGAPDTPLALQGAPQWQTVHAPAHWQVLDFVSDLHLRDEDPATLHAFLAYLERLHCDALFILGDLFEVWVGDDVLQADAQAAPQRALLQACTQVLRAASARTPVYLLRGNRDFLLGPAFAAASGVQLIADPSVLDWGEQRWLLSHGDAWCLADTDYLQFRQRVRSDAWQQAFLAQPLAQREAVARQLRSQSEQRKRHSAAALHSEGATIQYADVDADCARAWLDTSVCRTLIHGHTHCPGEHDLGQGRQRWVLSDWCGQSQPARSEVLRLQRKGCWQRLRPEAAAAAESDSWPTAGGTLLGAARSEGLA